MISDILAQVANFVINIISDSGYFGISFLMTLESACIPIPSEIIMPFAGYLVAVKKLSLIWVIIWGAIGNLTGSIIAYWVGVSGGRSFILRYGKYILLKQEELDKAQRFFDKYGSFSIFFSRLLPIIRTFISLPAGIAKMAFWRFSLYTIIGSLFWSTLLTCIGLFLGENWKSVETYFQRFDWAILILLVVSILFFVYKKIKKNK